MMRFRWIRIVGMGTAAVVVAIGLASTAGGRVGAAAPDITGVVTGAKGPEPGVWVIAETKDLPTSFRKIVVTDDAGKFLIPELPAASYQVWVRGYGLVDSDKTTAKPGADMRIRVKPAATPQQAAEIYPANYWYSLMQIPEAGDFPGTGNKGNGIGPLMKTQADWIDRMKDGCQLCHQLGNKATREMPMQNEKDHKSSRDAWLHRLRAGGAVPRCSRRPATSGATNVLELYAEWTDRIKAGAVPLAPPRPRGQERNVVLTMWGWAGPRGMIHDEVVTDKRNPTLYPNGPVYGVGGGGLVIVDPVTHRAEQMDMTTRTPMQPPANGLHRDVNPFESEPVTLLGNRARQHAGIQLAQPDDGRQGPRLDHTDDPSRHRHPAWCKEGSNNVRAVLPARSEHHGRQISYYDPKTKQFTLIDTCFGTHHLQFEDDANDTL